VGHQQILYLGRKRPVIASGHIVENLVEGGVKCYSFSYLVNHNAPIITEGDQMHNKNVLQSSKDLTMGEFNKVCEVARNKLTARERALLLSTEQALSLTVEGVGAAAARSIVNKLAVFLAVHQPLD
jgi:hypothetical protein